MGISDVLDSSKYIFGEWQVTVTAIRIFAGIIIITLSIWGLMRWRYGGIIDKKNVVIDEKDATIQKLGTTINLGRTQQEALAREIDSLNGTVITLKSQTNATPAQQANSIVHVESIVVNITRINEQLSHTLTAIGASSATGITDMSFPNRPLALREEEERIKAEKERLK